MKPSDGGCWARIFCAGCLVGGDRFGLVEIAILGEGGTLIETSPQVLGVGGVG